MTRPLRAIAVGAIAALSAVWAFAVNAQTADSDAITPTAMARNGRVMRRSSSQALDVADAFT